MSECEEYPKLETVCRFCLNEFGEIQIFGDTKTSLPLRIMTCMNLEIKADDVPCQMCVECRVQIEKFFVFRKRAIFYDQKFRKHLRLQNAGRKSTVFEHNDSDDEDDELEITDSVAIMKEYDNQKKQTLRDQEFKEKEENIRKTVEEKMRQQFKKKLKELRNEMLKRIREEESTKVISELEEFLKVKKNSKKCFKSESIVKQQNDSLTNDDQFIYIVSCAKENKPTENKTSNEEIVDNNYDFPMDEADDQFFSEENTYETLDICEEEEGEELKMIEKNDINSLPENEIFETACAVIENSGNEINDPQQQNDKISLNDSSADKKIILEQGIYVYKCDKCAQSFTKGLALERHKNVHNKNGVFCPDCDKFFPTKSSLEKHARTHSGLRPFQCEICEKSFTQKEVLQRHMFTHYGPKSKPHQCPYCELAFVQKQVLNQHINMKHSENPIIPKHGCEFCSKKFLYASGLSRHLLIHTGVVFTCNNCSKKFTDKSSLKRHLKLHVKKVTNYTTLSVKSDKNLINSK